MAIQGTQVPIYTNTLFLYFSNFSFLFLFWKQNKIKTKQPSKNKQTTWKAWKKDAYAWRCDRKMQMHESMIPKADKKSSKESPTLDRKN